MNTDHCHSLYHLRPFRKRCEPATYYTIVQLITKIEEGSYFSWAESPGNVRDARPGRDRLVMEESNQRFASASGADTRH
jgi:hypothetical protein